MDSTRNITGDFGPNVLVSGINVAVDGQRRDHIIIDNEDYRGWLNVENTNIDYPVLQSYDNQYYLDKDINREYLMSGSIFMNYLNDGFNDENTVLFGHNMRNKTMFAQLKKYKEKEFFYGNNNIEI